MKMLPVLFLVLEVSEAFSSASLTHKISLRSGFNHGLGRTKCSAQSFCGGGTLVTFSGGDCSQSSIHHEINSSFPKQTHEFIPISTALRMILSFQPFIPGAILIGLTILILFVISYDTISSPLDTLTKDVRELKADVRVLKNDVKFRKTESKRTLKQFL
jgi:hypothetical protein